MGLLFNPDQPGRGEKKRNYKNEKRWGFASPNSISGGIRSVSDQTEPRRDRAGCAAGAASPGSAAGRAPRGPHGSASSKACSLSPPQKKPSKREILVFGAANGRDILGVVLFSCCLSSSSCLLLLLHFFDLSSLPLPSCLSFGGEMLFPSPPATCASRCRNPGGSADRPPRGFENQKSSATPEAKRPNIQLTHSSESTQLAPKSFDVIIYMVASKRCAKPTGRPVQRYELFQR